MVVEPKVGVPVVGLRLACGGAKTWRVLHLEEPTITIGVNNDVFGLGSDKVPVVIAPTGRGLNRAKGVHRGGCRASYRGVWKRLESLLNREIMWSMPIFGRTHSLPQSSDS